jgi:hypothetical protein
MRKEIDQLPLYQIPAKLTISPYINAAQKEIADKVNLTSTVPESWNESASNVPNNLYKTTSSFLPSQLNYITNNTRLAISPTVSGKPAKKLNFLQKQTRKTANWGIRGINRLLRTGKDNLVNPFLYAQINTAEFALGNVFDSVDFEEARKAGGVFMPKFGRIPSSTNYLSTWSGNLLYAISPRFTKGVWRSTEGLKNTVFRPVRNSWQKLKKTSRNFESKFYSPLKYRTILANRRKSREIRHDKLQGRINRWKEQLNAAPWQIKEFRTS